MAHGGGGGGGGGVAQQTPTKNLYALLGLAPPCLLRGDIALSEIKRAYKALILKHHPDKVQGAQSSCGQAVLDDDATTMSSESESESESHATFIAIQHAYQVLSDTARRKQYDAQLAQDEASQKALSENQHAVVLDNVVTSELLDGDMCSRPCNCGGVFHINVPMLISQLQIGQETFVRCDGCSYVVAVERDA